MLEEVWEVEFLQYGDDPYLRYNMYIVIILFAIRQ